jgi:hypothetical protein
MNISHRIPHPATNVGLPQGERWKSTRVQIPELDSLSIYAVTQGEKGEKAERQNQLKIDEAALGIPVRFPSSTMV